MKPVPPEPVYSILALHDLEQIEGRYIYELQNPSRGAWIVEEIQDAVDRNSAFPMFGIPLERISGRSVHYRYWRVVGYLVIYVVTADGGISVVRILPEKSDYLQELSDD